MDKDDIGSDEMSATMKIDVKSLIANLGVEGKDLNGRYIWKNMIGSPLNQGGSDTKTLMNENPEFASTWKGRILV